jgi:hypothetical protein
MSANKRWIVIALALMLTVGTVAGCQQLSKIVKPKASSTTSSSSGTDQSSTFSGIKSGTPALTEFKYMSLAGKVLYPVTNGTFEDHIFSIINCPIIFSGLSFTGSSKSAADWCNSQGGRKADCVKSFECDVSGTISQDKSKVDNLKYNMKIIVDDKTSRAGKFEITGIPFGYDNDFRKSKSGSINFHRYYDLRGEGVAEHVALMNIITYSEGYSELTKADFVWKGNAGFTTVFKLANIDVN